MVHSVALSTNEQVNHPNIVKFYDNFENDDVHSLCLLFIHQAIYIVMELITGGELFDRIAGRHVLTELEVFTRGITLVFRPIVCYILSLIVLLISIVCVLFIVI